MSIPSPQPVTAPNYSISTAVNLLKEIWGSVQGNPSAMDGISFAGEGSLPSYFAVTDLAAASMGATGLALAELTQNLNVRVDRRLASFWFNKTISPIGWKIPPSPP